MYQDIFRTFSSNAWVTPLQLQLMHPLWHTAETHSKTTKTHIYQIYQRLKHTYIICIKDQNIYISNISKTKIWCGRQKTFKDWKLIKVKNICKKWQKLTKVEYTWQIWPTKVNKLARLKRLKKLPTKIGVGERWQKFAQLTKRYISTLSFGPPI